MPTTHKIPARTERHCSPCEFHKCTGALFTRIGPGGWKEYSCTHPNAFQEGPLPTDPEKAALAGELRALCKKEGRHIGKTEVQPDWCPLRRREEDSVPL